ncbi:MAG: hypothetical protein QOK40_3172 [Miltoncostaeaceae bacterium]|nr:hypothetical protein [Miltoncostaeaceae bacterium]
MAGALGLPGARASTIAAAVLEEGRLAAILSDVPAPARSLAAQLAFSGGRTTVVPRSPVERQRAARALERRGLAFAFALGWQREYRVPTDLTEPLRREIARPHAAALPTVASSRMLGAPIQTAHDAAALFAQLRRSPARVRADGDIYQRAYPKLVDALPVLDELPRSPLLDGQRVESALAFLREGGLLRVGSDDRPGGDGRRELSSAGDLAATLRRPPAELRQLILERCQERLGACAMALGTLRPDEPLPLWALGAALRSLAAEAAVGVGDGLPDPELALRAIVPAWLAGALELGVDAAGAPSTVRVRAVDGRPPAGPLAVCRPSFELVLRRRPTAGERLTLDLLCARVPGQPERARLTPESVRAGARELGPEGALGALRRLTADGLPPAVAAAAAEWAGSTRRLRLRSALLIDAGDPATADDLAAGPLGRLVVERMGERLLAIAAIDLGRAERALLAAGHELEPGVDRVSGAWNEPQPAPSEADVRWRPRRPLGGPASVRGERQLSTLDGARASRGNEEGPLYVLRALEG